MTIEPWANRATEQARLLNPAFIAAVTWSCTNGYHSINQQGMPYPLAFIAVPVILHKGTREILPRTIRTSVAAWLGENSQVHVRFTERATSLVPIVKEGILFGVNGRLLSLSSSQIVAASRPRIMTRFLEEASDEVRDCMARAKFVGKWFASSSDYTTIMALWGVMP